MQSRITSWRWRRLFSVLATSVASVMDRHGTTSQRPRHRDACTQAVFGTHQVCVRAHRLPSACLCTWAIIRVSGVESVSMNF